MRSHRYNFTSGDGIGPVLVPALGFILIALLIHVVTGLKWLNAPSQARDPDKTLLAYKHEASLQRSAASIILVGDSSCTTGIDPLLLSNFPLEWSAGDQSWTHSRTRA